MHVQARQFIERSLKDYGPITGRVVEFGSRDVNGGIRDLFSTASKYLGIDTHAGPGVDQVVDAADWQPEVGYQCIVTTETFEHTARWPEILAVAKQALAPDGIMLITCATNPRKPHSEGIPNTGPQAGEYYGNVSRNDLQQVADDLGLLANITIDPERGDLYATLRHRPPMTRELSIIGAGMWRTGTVSLKSALEKLLNKPCHHMTELLIHPQQTNQWLRIVKGAQPDWPSLLQGYGATLDWPSMAYWQQLASAYPGALILLSTREPEDWWRSISQTVLQSAPTKDTARTPWDQLVVELFENHFVGRFPTKDQAIKAYNDHNQAVRAAIAPNRLIEWQPSDGWLPLCRALNLPVPPEPFPHLNTTADYRRNNRL